VTAPLGPLAVSFAAGVWLGLQAMPPRWIPAAGLGLALLGAIALGRRRLPAASAAILALVALAGWARAGLADPWPDSIGLHPGRMRVEGIVSGEPETDGPRTRVSLVVRSAADATAGVEDHPPRPARGHLVLQLYGPTPPLAPRDHIRVTLDLRLARPFRNPGEPGGGGETRNELPLIAVAGGGAVERLPPAPVPWWLAVRLFIDDATRAHLPPVSGALFEGLLIGERRHLPATLTSDFRGAGVFHVLAISGFNVGLVATAIFIGLGLLRLPGRVAAAVALVGLVAFAAVVGAQPSVVRATIMVGLVLGGQVLARESGAWNSLAAALLALLAWEPDALHDPGLQLSFAATAGILHLTPPLRAAIATVAPRPLAAAVAVSIGAQLAVTPLMLMHFSQLSVVGVLANLAVVPLAALATTLGLLAVLATAASDGLGYLFFQSLWLCLLALRAVVRAFAAMPWAAVYAPPPPAVAVAAAGIALVMAPRARGRGAWLCVGGLGLLAVSTTAWRSAPDGKLHVLALDVGQGDAIVVRAPDGETLLVDTGGGGPGRADRGERVVIPALHRLGIRRLAALAVTHDDPDHAGGLAGVLGGIPVGEVWAARGTETDPWRQALGAAGVPSRSLARGDRLWLGPVLVTVLHPTGPGLPHEPGEALDDNNRSLVLRLDWGLTAGVLCGDAEAPAERRLLAAGVPLGAMLLKVGHHGSAHASSEPFLGAVSPRIAVVSAGRRNPFGHPAPATLGRLARAGADIYRTDLDGAVEIVSDGERLVIRAWARPAAEREISLAGAP
jgi:competence protein ComEC